MKKICVAGNIIVDMLYPISVYPKRGELTTIGNNISRSSGGAVCNVAMDLAILAPDMDISALGIVGEDPVQRRIIAWIALPLPQGSPLQALIKKLRSAD